MPLACGRSARNRGELRAGGGVAGFQRSATMKPLMALMLAAMAAVHVFGTAQVPDKLILDGKEVPLFGEPLEWLWLDDAGQPVINCRGFEEGVKTAQAREALGASLMRRPEVFWSQFLSTTCMRGYVATWRLDGDRLLLVRIERWRMRDNPEAATDADAEPSIREVFEVPVEKVLPGRSLPVFAEWFTGALLIPHGDFMSYNWSRDQSTPLEFRKGVLVGKVPKLQVSAIRELKGGESMHAASFPAEWEKLQAETAAEKAAEAKTVDEPAK